MKWNKTKMKIRDFEELTVDDLKGHLVFNFAKNDRDVEVIRMLIDKIEKIVRVRSFSEAADLPYVERIHSVEFYSGAIRRLIDPGSDDDES